MAPPYVGGAHGHHVISIVSVIKEEHVLLCKDMFNPQGLGFRASCILNMHDILLCMHNACITDYLGIHCTPCSMTLIAQRPRPPPVTCTICTPPQDHSLRSGPN